MSSADETDWTLKLPPRSIRVSLCGFFTLLAVLISMRFVTKPRRLPLQTRKKSRRSVNRFGKYSDVFRKAKTNLENIPNSLRFENENELISMMSSMNHDDESKKNIDEKKESFSKEDETGLKISTKSTKEEDDNLYLELDQDQNVLPYLDTINLVKKIRQIDAKRSLLDKETLDYILKTSMTIPSDYRGEEYAADYEEYSVLGEFPYFSLGHGFVTRGLRSRKFRYLYTGRRIVWRRFIMTSCVFFFTPLIVLLPLGILLEDLDDSWVDILLTYSIASPVLFIGTIMYNALRDATPNPLKRAYGPIVSWYVLSTMLPIILIVACLENYFSFESTSMKYFVLALQVPFPVVNLASVIHFVAFHESVREWLTRLTVEQRFLSRPSTFAKSSMIYVLPFLPFFQIIASGLMLTYAENRLKNVSDNAVSYFVVLMFFTSTMSLLIVVFGVLGATRRNLIGSNLRSAREAVAPQLQSIPVLLLLISISMKMAFAGTIIISAVSGYRDLNTLDQIVFYFVVVGALTSIVEACLLVALGSRYYLIRKMKKRFGYHPAPFEVIVPSALSYSQRKHMQQEPDHDTDSDLSGLDDSEGDEFNEEEEEIDENFDDEHGDASNNSGAKEEENEEMEKKKKRFLLFF